MDESPQPKIGILGAGPIGIEAALYARYLGYPVDVYEQGDACEHVRDWCAVQMFSPFEMNRSELGLAALSAQDEHFCPPDDRRLMTGQQWIDEYLLPLSTSDLLSGSIHYHAAVQYVGRQDQIKSDNVGKPERANTPFRIAVRRASELSFESADIVLDATGNYGTANWMGCSGMPAVGEKSLRATIPQLCSHESISANGDQGGAFRNLMSYRIPPLSQLGTLAGFRFVVIGSGYSAATNIVNLEILQQSQPGLECIWLTRHGAHPNGPVSTIDNDPLPYRQQLSARANQLALEANWLTWRPESQVRSIQLENELFKIELEPGLNQQSDNQGNAGETRGDSLQCHHVLANVGFQGNFEMLEPLQLHRCYASGGPMGWAASIAGSGADCLQQSCAGPEALVTTEPDFYILGSKSYGRDPRFLFSTGLQQIRDVFKLIHHRPTLDLYSTAHGKPLTTT